MTTELDVIVIGAGLSGLSAAYQLKCADNLRVIVLEAKDRIGGRTLSVKLKAANEEFGDVWDLGGQWVSRSQPHILSLLEQLGIETFNQHTEGIKLMQIDGHRIKQYSGQIPKIPFLANIELMRFINKIERLSQQVPASNPYSFPKAAEFDGMTCETFKNQHLKWQASRELMEVAFRVTFGCESSRLSCLYFLAYCQAAGGMMHLFEAVNGGAQEMRVKGGAQQICTILAQKLGKDTVLLNRPVTDIYQDDEKDVVTVFTGNGDCFRASRVIMAIPLTEAVKIIYKPNLSEPRRILLQNMPVGHLTKFIITYEKAFWRDHNYSGEIVSNGGAKLAFECDSGPLGVVYDATSATGNPALVGFIAGHQGIQWSVKSPSERRGAVLQSLSLFFGNDALYPLDYIEKNWSEEPYNGGCPVNVISPGLMQYVGKYLRTPHGRIHWAGTETATVWCGYLNGAVQSGWRAAKEVLHDLRPDYFLDKNIETNYCYESLSADSLSHEHVQIPKFFHFSVCLTLLGLCLLGIRRMYFRMAI